MAYIIIICIIKHKHSHHTGIPENEDWAQAQSHSYLLMRSHIIILLFQISTKMTCVIENYIINYYNSQLFVVEPFKFNTLYCIYEHTKGLEWTSLFLDGILARLNTKLSFDIHICAVCLCSSLVTSLILIFIPVAFEMKSQRHAIREPRIQKYLSSRMYTRIHTYFKCLRKSENENFAQLII